MNGPTSAMLWYVFCLAALFFTVGGGVLQTLLAHRQRLRALDVLKIYAEKGAEPPQSVTETLLGKAAPPSPEAAPAPAPNPGAAWSPKKVKRRERYLQDFSSSLFMAAAAGGIAWWRHDVGPPHHWAFYAAAIAAFVFSVSSVGALIAAISTPAEG